MPHPERCFLTWQVGPNRTLTFVAHGTCYCFFSVRCYCAYVPSCVADGFWMLDSGGLLLLGSSCRHGTVSRTFETAPAVDLEAFPPRSNCFTENARFPFDSPSPAHLALPFSCLVPPHRLLSRSSSSTKPYPKPVGALPLFSCVCACVCVCVAIIQWPYMPQEWRDTLTASPWLKMFQNARKWCDEHPREG